MIKKLDNGVTILFEKNENIRSATLGIWVKNGSRNEPKDLMGISHFIEHMIFKGTKTRTAKELSKELDAIGGQMNAFTTKECTCYYVKSLDIHLEKAINIISDMFFNSNFNEKDVDLERTVIEEEIAMYEDQPDDVVLETIGEIVYEGSSLARPVLGTKQSLSQITGEKMKAYMQENYVSNNIVVSVTGSFSNDNIEQIIEIFSKMTNKKAREIEKTTYCKKSKFIEKDIAQNHICIAFEGIKTGSVDKYALNVLNSILGGGMSSRLFQKVREENGLCYSISSFNMSSIETGVFLIYVATSKSTEEKAIKLIREVLVDFINNGITDEELEITREQIKANVIMGLESSTARMHYLARATLFSEQILTEDEIINAYDKVSKNDVLKLANKMLDLNNVSWAVVGDISNEKVYKM